MGVTFSRAASHYAHSAAIIHTVSPSPYASHRQDPRRVGIGPGEARRGEAARDARHRTTPTCGLRRRSSRHHHLPPNLDLGKTTATAAGNPEPAVPGSPPPARPCTSPDKLFLILAHPAAYLWCSGSSLVVRGIPTAQQPQCSQVVSVCAAHLCSAPVQCLAHLHTRCQDRRQDCKNPKTGNATRPAATPLHAPPPHPRRQPVPSRHYLYIHSRSLDPCLPYELANRPPPGATNQLPGACEAHGGFASLKPLLHSGHSVP